MWEVTGQMEKRVEITIMMIIKVKTKHNRTCLLGAVVCATVPRV